jgi:ATP/maltotriose-dependent transcriptional regulator MalT
MTAPAGFGKTTLLAGWSEALTEQKHPVAWLSLDGEDDDPQQFGAYLVAALARASAEIAWQAQQLLNNDALTPIKTVISVLLNGIAACGRSVFLVLDDADRLTAKPVLAIVSRLLRYVPENMHVLLGARGDHLKQVTPCAVSHRRHCKIVHQQHVGLGLLRQQSGIAVGEPLLFGECIGHAVQAQLV